MRILLFCLIAIFVFHSQASVARTRGVHKEKSLSIDDHVGPTRKLRTTSIPPATTPGTFKQIIDHAGDPTQTFTQRYWQNSSFATDAHTAPVILHICGEADCTNGYFLNDSALDWAKALGAHVVYLEHRFYGRSLPYKDTSTAHLKSLTLDNVLEDLATFQKSISAAQGWTGRWIVVGGSYSGTIAALYRQKHPELVVGALASSAPMISGAGEDADVDGPFMGDEERAWAYQACTELGYWTADGPFAGATLHKPSLSSCEQTFPGAPHFSETDYNRKYDDPFLSSGANTPTNILFTYGSNDVWTEIGLSKQTNANAGISVRVLNGAVHHFDLNAATSTDSGDVIKIRAEFLALARTWLQK